MKTQEKKSIQSLLDEVREHNLKEQEEEHPWLLSYSDMFTLLFCMFVVLIAMAFKHLDWVKIEQMLKVFSPRHNEMSLPELYEKVQQLIKQYGLEETVNVQLTSRGVEIDFKEKATFDKGQATLKSDILPVLTVISKLLNEKGIDKRKVIVEGHSDSLPISTKEFPSNWELSTARAGTVVRFLTEHGLNSKRFEAVGYADTRPKVQYTHPILGQPENRRVVVVVSPEPFFVEYSREEISVKEMNYDEVRSKLTAIESKNETLGSVFPQKLSTEEKSQNNITGRKVKPEIVLQQNLIQQQERESSKISAEQKRLMEQYFAIGQRKFKEGNYNAAIIYFQKVLEIDPEHKLSKLNIERAKKKLQEQ